MVSRSVAACKGRNHIPVHGCSGMGWYGRIRSAFAVCAGRGRILRLGGPVSGAAPAERSTRMYVWTTYDSPLGTLTLAGSQEALTGLWLPGQKYFASTLPPDAGRQDDLPVFRQAASWLDAYFGRQLLPTLPPLAPRAATSARRSGGCCWRSLTGRPPPMEPWPNGCVSVGSPPPPRRWAARWATIPSPS